MACNLAPFSRIANRNPGLTLNPPNFAPYKYEHDEQRADSVYDLVPPHCADAPLHDAITDYELEIVLVSVTARRQPGWGETWRTFMPRAIVIIHDCLKTSASNVSMSAVVYASEKRPVCACVTRRLTLVMWLASEAM